MIRAMFLVDGALGFGMEQAAPFVDAQLAIVIPLGIVGSVAWYRPLFGWLARMRARLGGGSGRLADGLSDLVVALSLAAVFLLCAIDLSASTHNPFIYFQF
jgi:hypothetical protein